MHGLVLSEIFEVTPKGATTLKKRDNEILKLKCNLLQLKIYVEEKTTDTGGDMTEFSRPCSRQ